jgi:hypothetical protein
VSRLIVLNKSILVLMIPCLEDEFVQLGLSPLFLTVMLQSLFYNASTFDLLSRSRHSGVLPMLSFLL